jgi:hypothetical protein
MGKGQAIVDTEKELLEKVSKELLMDYTKKISSEVRLSGTQEELRSFTYVKNKLSDFGIHTELTFHDAYISLPKKAEVRVNGKVYKAITHSMAKDASKGIEGRIIFTDKESIENVDLQGRIVLIKGIANREMVQQLSDKQAVAVIFINATYTNEMIVSPVWGTPIPENLGLLPMIPIVSVTEAVGEQLKESIKENEDVCLLRSEVETKIRKIPTLVAEIPGREEKEQFVLFSGHIDSWHYGAMDNASANATMIEVARILSDYQGKLRRTVRFAFWSGHSHGRYAGSSHYCDEHWEELTDNCVVHINIDSVGAKGADVLTSGACMKETKQLAADVIGALSGQVYQGSRFGRNGDQSFWGTGTPSLFMGLSTQPPHHDDPKYRLFEELFKPGKSHGFGWWWHTTEDTMDKIDPDNLKRDCQIYLIVVYRFLNQALIPIDQNEAASDVEQGINHWKELAGTHLDFSRTTERLSTLKNLLIRFTDVVKEVGETDSFQITLINDTIMALSRTLVPLNYVKGSIFEHDLGFKQEAVPRLSSIEQLIQFDVGSKEYLFLKTSLNRKVTEINYLLKQANNLLEERLGQVETLLLK